MIALLNPVNIEALWPEIQEMIQPILTIEDTHDPEHIRDALLSGNAQIWVQWSDHIDGLAITEFVTFPKCMWLRVWLGSARKGRKTNWFTIKDMIYRFAKAHGCVGVRIDGRAGWKRLFPEAQQHAVILTHRFSKEIH